MKFKKTDGEIVEAIRWDGTREKLVALEAFLPRGYARTYEVFANDSIGNLEIMMPTGGSLVVCASEWIVKNGDYCYCCDQNTFTRNYEPVEPLMYRRNETTQQDPIRWLGKVMGKEIQQERTREEETITLERFKQIKNAKTQEELDQVVDKYGSSAGLGFNMAVLYRTLELRLERLEARGEDTVVPTMKENPPITIQLDRGSWTKLCDLANKNHMAPFVLARLMLVIAIDKGVVTRLG